MRQKKLILCVSIGLLVIVIQTGSVEAAKKFKVRSVEFAGNEVYSDKRLMRLILTRPHHFYSRSYYYPEILQGDMENLLLFYRQSGFLEAAISDFQVVADSTAGTVNIRIEVFEGELTHIEGISIFGSKAFSDTLLLNKALVQKGDPFRRGRINDGILSILSFYADHGYLDAQVHPDIRINVESHRALIDLTIKEHFQSRVNDLRIENLKKTERKTVTRELSFKKGDLASRSDFLRSQRQLYLTGLFQSVFIHPVPAADQDSMLKDVIIDLKESESVELNLYLGYGSVEQGRTRIEFNNNNIAGTGRKTGISTYLSFISYGAVLSFSEPRILGLRWKTDLNLLYEYRKEPAYDIERTGGRLVVGRKILNRSLFSLAYRYEKSNLSNVDVTYDRDKLQNDIRSLKLSLSYDTRSNMFNPNKGVYLESSSEIAGSFLGGTEDFWKLLGRFKYFYPAGASTVIATSIETGWMGVFGQSLSIPLNERFYLGGPNVMRGFDYRMVGPLDKEKDPLGGKFLLAFNLIEIRRVIYRMLGGVIFVDAGNLWNRIDDFRTADIRYNTGIGIRANTPLGIVRCDYGVNLDRRDGEPAGRIYFSIGQAF